MYMSFPVSSLRKNQEGVHDQVEWSSGQPDLVVSDPAYGKGLELDDL